MDAYILIGLPNSGKSTIARESFKELSVVSRDDILMEYGREKFGDLTYSEIFCELTSQDHKKIDELFHQKIKDLQKEKKNFVIDATHLTKASRKRRLKYINDDYNVHYLNVVCGFDTILKRNRQRAKKEGKYIPEDVLRNMFQRYEPPSEKEDPRIKSVHFIITDGF